MRTRFGTARHRRQHSQLRLCPLNRAPHRRRLLSPCGLFPALAVAAAAPQHPAAYKTIAITIGGSERLPITARLPAPGWALWRETAPPPVDYKHRFHRRQAVTSQGQADRPSLPGGHWSFPQPHSSSLHCPSFWPSSHHCRRPTHLSLGYPQTNFTNWLFSFFFSICPRRRCFSHPR